MKGKDNDYSAYLFLLVIGILLILVSQCEANHELGKISYELEEISHELRMLRIK